MIKCLFVEESNGCVPANMFAMAGFAQPVINIRNAPVITFLGFDVLFDIFVVMAVKAQIILK